MPATKARSTNMIRRQSFTGKTLSFIEVIFNQNYSGSATTPESDGSTFQTVTNEFIAGPWCQIAGLRWRRPWFAYCGVCRMPLHQFDYWEYRRWGRMEGTWIDMGPGW